jgi:hypothetical protein
MREETIELNLINSQTILELMNRYCYDISSNPSELKSNITAEIYYLINTIFTNFNDQIDISSIE